MTHLAAKALFATGLAAFAAWAPLRLAAAEDQAAPSGEAQDANPYARLNDQQWTKLAEDWERLDRAERRWFLTEVRKRHLRPAGLRPARHELPIKHRERARFGNVAPLAEAGAGDASAKKRPRTPDDAKKYGLGFEQRHRERSGEAASRGDASAGEARAPTSTGARHTPDAERAPSRPPRTSSTAL